MGPASRNIVRNKRTLYGRLLETMLNETFLASVIHNARLNALGTRMAPVSRRTVHNKMALPGRSHQVQCSMKRSLDKGMGPASRKTVRNKMALSGRPYRVRCSMKLLSAGWNLPHENVIHNNLALCGRLLEAKSYVNVPGSSQTPCS